MSLKFDHLHYVPILKGKQGELDAIKETSPEVRDAFTPLLEVPAIPLKYLEGEYVPIPAKSIDDHVNRVAENFAKALGPKHPAFIDGQRIEEEEALDDGSEPVTEVFNVLRKNMVKFIPTIGLDRVAEYAEAVKAAIKEDGRGCCLRLIESDLEALADLEDQIKSLLKFLGVNPPEVDLIVDFEADVPARAAFVYQVNGLPMLNKWRTVTVASSSFPENMERVAQNSLVELERSEWLAWLFLRSNKEKLARIPSFDDYAINHPVLSEIDPRIMRMSPNIRYTAAVNYVIAKGEALPRKTDRQKKAAAAPSDQYPKLAGRIMKHPSWTGKKFSWGDAFIEDCSQKKRVGNATNWRAVGTSHHIAFAVRQLANLP